MNDNAKKAGLVALIVVALGAAIWGATSFFNSDQPRVEKVIQIPEGSRSMKDIEMENQARQQGGATGAEIAAGAPVGGGKDEGLGGSLQGK